VPFPLVLASSVLGFEKLDPTCRTEGLPLTSLGAIAQCVQVAGGCRAEQALGVALPRIGDLLPAVLNIEEIGVCVPSPSGDLDGLADPKQAQLAVRCQQGTTAAGRHLLMQRIAAARQCVDGLLACRLSGRSLVVCTKVAARCEQRLAALDQGPKSAVAKLATSIVPLVTANPRKMRCMVGLGAWSRSGRPAVVRPGLGSRVRERSRSPQRERPRTQGNSKVVFEPGW